MTHVEIVRKLIGPISPRCHGNADPERFNNMKAMCSLLSVLVNDVEEVVRLNKHAQEASIKEIVEYAKNFLEEELEIKQSE